MSRPRALIVTLCTLGLLAMPTLARAADLGVTIVSPAHGSTVGATVAITVEATGPVTAVAFDVAVDPDPTWTAIGVDADGTDGWTATWSPAGPDGVATIRATATDGSSTVEHTVAVTVDTSAPSLTLASSRSAFSPNGDRRAEWTTIRVTVEERVRVAVIVLDADGRIRSRLAEGTLGTGVSELRWDGTNASGATLGDGRYTVRAEVADDLGNTRRADLAVVLDTRAPALRWRGASPEPYRGIGRVRFSVHAADRSPKLTAHAVVFDALGRKAAVLDKRGFGSGPFEMTWNGRDSRGRSTEPGLHHVEIRVRDDAGNLATTRRQPFRNHRAVHALVTRHREGGGRQVALTFDDCWNGAAWKRVLDVLDAKNAGGSFFCLGASVAANPTLARRTVADGHTIGSHAFDHANTRAMRVEEIRARVRKDIDVWWRVARATPAPYFRPPFGLWDDDTRLAIGAEGFRYLILWDVDPWDWSYPGASAVVSRVMSHVHRGSIVVMHAIDGTAQALPTLIDRLRARGLEPVTLAELLH